ncbi:MAG: glycosyltransferase family 9 protein [Planctomycetota bacterium]
MEDRFAALLRHHPQIDALHIYDRRRYRLPWRWWRIPGFVRRLRRERYDVAVDLQGNLKSGILARLAGARRCAGLAAPLSREGNHLFVRHRVPAPDGHRLDAYLALVNEVIGHGATAPAVLPARPADHRGVVLHPGTSAFGAFKRWPPASYAALGDRLAERLDAPVLVTAGPAERGHAEEVRRRMRRAARIVEPADLSALVDLLAGARLVVAGDTGPAHLAAALEVPTVALFGPKDPRVLAPVGPRVRPVRTGVRCSPCALRFCPDPVCMTELSVDLVERHALELLEVKR